MIAIAPTFRDLLNALAVRFVDGAVLFVGGLVAMAEACCCATTPEAVCHREGECCLADDAAVRIQWEGATNFPNGGNTGQPCPGDCDGYTSGDVTFSGALIKSFGSGDWTSDFETKFDTTDAVPGVDHYHFSWQHNGPVFRARRVMDNGHCSSPFPNQCELLIRVTEASASPDTWPMCCGGIEQGIWGTAGSTYVFNSSYFNDSSSCLAVARCNREESSDLKITITVTNNRCCRNGTLCSAASVDYGSAGCATSDQVNRCEYIAE